MIRKLLALAALFVFAPFVGAQDMPLSQILIDGEGWKNELRQKFPDPSVAYLNTEINGKFPLVYTRSSDGQTLFAGYAAGRAVWAFRLDKDGKVTHGNAYCPLRVRRGDEGIAVTGLATDKDGRIYAATEIGIQVYDPTGRLCGVMASPSGKPRFLAFEGDQLTLWIGETIYTRKLRTTGVK